MWCSLHPMSESDFLHSASAYHLERIVGWIPCFCLAFLSICFARKYILCLSEAPCLTQRLSVCLVHVTRDRGNVTVVLVELRWTPRRLQIPATTAMDYHHFPVGIAVKALLFGIFAKFEELGVVHVGDQLFAMLNLLILAARGVAVWKGLSSRTRHMEVKFLWLQSTLAKGQLEWKKVSTCDNPADILTKPTSREELRRRLTLVGGELHEAVENGGNMSDVPRIVSSLAG